MIDSTVARHIKSIAGSLDFICLLLLAFFIQSCVADPLKVEVKDCAKPAVVVPSA